MSTIRSFYSALVLLTLSCSFSCSSADPAVDQTEDMVFSDEDAHDMSDPFDASDVSMDVSALDVVADLPVSDMESDLSLVDVAPDMGDPLEGGVIVTTLDDVEDPQDNVLSLREALVVAARGDDPRGLIKFAPALTGSVMLNAPLIIGSGVTAHVYVEHGRVLALDGQEQHRLFITRDAELTLTGLTLERGFTSELSTAAGISMSGGELVLDRVTLRENEAGGQPRQGSGALHVDDGSVTILDSLFEANASGHACVMDWYSTEALTLRGVTMRDHRAVSGDEGCTGSLVLFTGAVPVKIQETTLSDNDGDGLVFRRIGAAEIDRLTCEDNAGACVRGLFLYRLNGERPTLRVTDSTFRRSAAGVYTYLFKDLALTIEGSTFEDIRDDRLDADGSMRIGSAIHWSFGGDATVKDSTFARNQRSIVADVFESLAMERLTFEAPTLSYPSVLASRTVQGSSVASCTMCTFREHVGARAITARGGVRVSILDSTFEDNSVNGDGAALYAKDAFGYEVNVLVERSTFSRNKAEGSSFSGGPFGGAISFQGEGGS